MSTGCRSARCDGADVPKVCLIQKKRMVEQGAELRANMADSEPILWFAMRATYHRELKLHNLLREKGVESFVPLEYREESVQPSTEARSGGRRVKRGGRRLVPMIANYIFIRTTTRHLQQIKIETPYLRYVVDRERQKITIPEEQMREFIRVSSTNDRELIYIQPEQLDIRQGERVRVTGGLFGGAQGTFVKIEGRRNRRFVVMLEGVMAVAAKVDSSMIERV